MVVPPLLSLRLDDVIACFVDRLAKFIENGKKWSKTRCSGRDNRGSARVRPYRRRPTVSAAARGSESQTLTMIVERRAPFQLKTLKTMGSGCMCMGRRERHEMIVISNETCLERTSEGERSTDERMKRRLDRWWLPPSLLVIRLNISAVNKYMLFERLFLIKQTSHFLSLFTFFCCDRF